MVGVTHAQVDAEVEIVWDRPREAVNDLTYIRETVRTLSSPTRPPRFSGTDGERVGYAVLANDATPIRPRGGQTGSPQYGRRVWWVASVDPYWPGPGEAVVPSSVAAGVESDPWVSGGRSP